MSFSPLSKLGIIQNLNYIANSDFNNFPFASNATLGWSLKNGGTPNATTKLPTAAPSAAAAGTLSLSAVSGGSQISGTVSASLSSTAATTAGDMLITDALTLDLKAQSTVQSFSFSYKVSANGTGTPNFSGTSSNAIGVAIYDVTNAAWIQPAGVFNLVQSSGVGRSSGSFQVPSNCTSVRLAVYFPNSTAASGGSPFTVIFDDFVLGPQTNPAGAAISDWVSFSPTLNTPIANSNTTGKYRRVGDTIEAVVYTDITGAPSAFGSYTVNISSIGSIDTSKLPSTDGEAVLLGTVRVSRGGASQYNGFVHYQSPTLVNARVQTTTTVTALGSGYLILDAVITQNVPLAFQNGDNICAEFKFPATGLSCNTVLSQDTDTRVVAARYEASSHTGAMVAGVVNYDTKIIDTHNAVTTGASWKFTTPVSGFYRIAAQIEANSSGSGTLTVQVRKNGVSSSQSNGPVNAATSFLTVQADSIIALSAGDYIEIFETPATGTWTRGGVLSTNFVNIERLSGPATIAASETVAASFGSSAGGSVADTIFTYIDFPSSAINTHNAVLGAGSGNSATYTNTWRFIAPISGIYSVSANLTFVQAAGISTSLDFFSIVAKNGSSVLRGQRIFLPSTSPGTPYGSNVSGLLRVNAGDAISIIGYQDNPENTSRNLEANLAANYVSIVRVGN